MPLIGNRIKPKTAGKNDSGVNPSDLSATHDSSEQNVKNRHGKENLSIGHSFVAIEKRIYQQVLFFTVSPLMLSYQENHAFDAWLFFSLGL